MINQERWNKIVAFKQINNPHKKVNVPTAPLDEYDFKGTLLDAASANTNVEDYLKSRGVTYVGVDLFPMPGKVIGDVHDLPFQNKAFDWIFSSHTLEHLISPMLFLIEANRVLKMSGKLLLITPYPDFGICWEHILVPTHEQLKRLVQRAGFNMISQKEIEYSVYTYCEKITEINL